MFIIKTASDRNKYKESRRNARRSVALAQEKTRQELVNEMESTAGKKDFYCNICYLSLITLIFVQVQQCFASFNDSL